MSKTLELSFTSTLNKPVKILLPDVKSKLSESLVRENMTALVKLNILNSTSGRIMSLQAARVIDKTTTVLFEEKVAGAGQK